MNLNNEQVKHRTFGVGRVISVEDGRIIIRFADEVGEKKFLYPGAIEQHLEMCNPSTQEYVLGLKNMLDALAAEQVRKEQQSLLEESNRLASEKAAARKTVAKKPVRKKA